jgi:sugar lactone lactonase YvrE
MDDLIYGKETQEVMPVNKPYGLKMHNGCIYVCDLRNHCVTVLDLRQHQIRLMGTTGTDKLDRPTDIAIAPDGTFYVADVGRNVIAVFDARERMIQTFAPPKCKPMGLAVYGDELYVCDSFQQRIVVLNRHTGAVLRTIGEPGVKDGQFYIPLGIAVDHEGVIYVSDVMRCRIQKFDRQGKLLGAFGERTDTSGGFVRPKHLAVDNQGHLFVVDAQFCNVQVFDTNGRLLTYFGSRGTHLGAMELPAGICVDSDPQDLALFKSFVHPAFEAEELVVVTNQVGSNKVAVYALGHLKSGFTVADVSAHRQTVASGLVDPRMAARPTPSPTTLPSDVPSAEQPALAAPASPAAPDIPAAATPAPTPGVPAAATPVPDVPAAPAAPAPSMSPAAQSAADHGSLGNGQ